MEKVTVYINIVDPDEPELFKDRDVGKAFSTTTDLKVNKVPAGYSIVFDTDEFMIVDINTLIKTAIKLFKENLTDKVVDLKVKYYYNDETFDEDVGEKVVELCKKLDKLNDVDSGVEYEDVNTADIEDSLDDDDYDDPFEALGFREDKKKRKKKKRTYYGTSKVYRNSKNAKRAVKRHGVMIANSRKDIKADEKVIKEFLKEFIPGDADWKKDFRNVVAKRWIKAMVVSKKQLKKYERMHRKLKSDKKQSKKTKNALNLTSRIFTAPADSWNNPNK